MCVGGVVWVCVYRERSRETIYLLTFDLVLVAMGEYKKHPN